MTARERYQRQRIEHWDEVAVFMDTWKGWGGYYHRRLTELYQFLIAPGQRVLEIGCGIGDLLAALKPARGVGIDFSGEMIRRAMLRHPEFSFIQADAHDLDLDEQFDIIVLSDVLNDLWDVQAVFEKIAPLAGRHTKIIINSYSRLWEPILAFAERLSMAKPTLYQNWLTVEDVANLLRLAGFETLRNWAEIIWPLGTPFVSTLMNGYLVRLWPFKHLALTNFIIAGPQPGSERSDFEPTVSVIVPARNEAGNIPGILERTPQMGGGTELVFVEGHSQDDTYEVILRETEAHTEWQSVVLRQMGVGKGDAVRFGFEQAHGDILMILDADMTVAPEDLKRFYKVLVSGEGEFVNGVRLVYPMEKTAMRFFNLVGNKFFSLAFSWLLGQPIKDTLCGTKVLWKRDYEKIIANRGYFGDFDPFGDFDLLFGAAKLNLKIVDVPIRYRERSYGDTNIRRWSQGWLLLKMVLFASRRIKFI